MLDYIHFFIRFIGSVITAMQSMYIVPGVSLFAFIVGGIIVVTVVACIFH